MSVKTRPVTYTNLQYDMAEDSTIRPGAIVCIDGGYAVEGSSATGLLTKGVAMTPPNGAQLYDNTDGADGDVKVIVQGGDAGSGGKLAHWLKNAAGGDAVTQAEVGKNCYVYDYRTVTKTATGRSVAGEVLRIDATKGVLVQFADTDDVATIAGDIDDLVDEVDALQVAVPSTAGIDGVVPRIQLGTLTLAAGVRTINTGITITANSVVTLQLTSGGAATSGARYRVHTKVVGGPGVGAFSVAAIDSASGNNVVNTDVSVFDYTIIG